MKLCTPDLHPSSSSKILRYAAQLPRQLFRVALPVVAAGLISLTPAHADVTTSGDVNPATDPLTWTYGADGTEAFIGDTGYGELTVDGGSAITSTYGYIGNNYGSSGTATVTGAGSQWTAYLIAAGANGTGALNITDGGVVDTKGAYFGYHSDSYGSGIVDGSGSALYLSSSLFVGSAGSGRLDITNGGSASCTLFKLGTSVGTSGLLNIDGVGSKLTAQSIPTNNLGFLVGTKGDGTISITNGGAMETVGGFMMALDAGTSTSVNVDGAGSSWNSSNFEDNVTFSLGISGDATLNITNGAEVSTTTRIGTIASESTSTSAINVDGPGSTWSLTIDRISEAFAGHFNVGTRGTGSLNITNGGQVASTGGYIVVGQVSALGGSGKLLVDGAGSSFSHDGEVNIGAKPSVYYPLDGIGRMTLSDGGVARVGSLNVSSGSLVSIDAGSGSSLIVGVEEEGLIHNLGTIRLIADASAANGIYTPLNYGGTTPTSSGAIQALGGVWNASRHLFSVSSVATAAAGEALVADLAETQRFLFTDGATGKSVGMSFEGTTDSTELAVSASAMGEAALASLLELLDPGQAVLSGWDFTLSDNVNGEPVYLSLFAGAGQILADLALWHFDGSAWLQLVDPDLAYEGDFASFTATGFSGYAVTGASPVTVPASVLLFGSGLAGLALFRRKAQG